jgi:exopolyphosphatase / guanosine-5'-triphosphate,3'-diphosphate pyrophosphatase
VAAMDMDEHDLPPAAAGEDMPFLEGTRPARDLYGALDLGTNNCRLLIARPYEPSFRVVDSFSRIVRLGEGLAATGALGEGAIERTLAALRVCAAKLGERRVGRISLIATEACRSASNGQAFLDRAEQDTGLRLTIVDRQTEAELAAEGCAVLMSMGAPSVILFDIGGGSTEIVWLSRAADGKPIRERILSWTSLPVGVVTLAERRGGVHVDQALFDSMVAEVADLLAPFLATVDRRQLTQGFHLLGTSGTVTTIAGLHLGLPRYDRRRVDGLWMSVKDADRVVRRLLQTPYEDRARNACIGADRADLVLAGCAIYEAIRRAFPADRIRIADRGLREGLLIRMMSQDGVWPGQRP